MPCFQRKRCSRTDSHFWVGNSLNQWAWARFAWWLCVCVFVSSTGGNICLRCCRHCGDVSVTESLYQNSCSSSLIVRTGPAGEAWLSITFILVNYLLLAHIKVIFNTVLCLVLREAHQLYRWPQPCCWQGVCTVPGKALTRASVLPSLSCNKRQPCTADRWEHQHFHHS